MSLRNVGEAVTAVSVVLGLVFVGVEINANTAAARAQSRQEIAAQNIDFLLRVAEDDELAAIWSATWTEEYVADLDATDRSKALMTAIALMIRLENIYLQHVEGFISAEALPNYGMVQRKFEEPGFWTLMGSVRGTFDPDFWAYFAGLHGRVP